LVVYIFSLFPPFPVLLEELVGSLSRVFFYSPPAILAKRRDSFPFNSLLPLQELKLQYWRIWMEEVRVIH
jgi:hypothetical protein